MSSAAFSSTFASNCSPNHIMSGRSNASQSLISQCGNSFIGISEDIIFGSGDLLTYIIIRSTRRWFCLALRYLRLYYRIYTYPFPASAGQMGMFSLTATLRHLVQRVL
ncbi:hypothetical protein ALC57_13543 [Trachymyrmex cornetzi]|uniref:Uncharacterized protein n=1 Tax=Trachymyrmex cornetzi TaxID=471704 RepID=A0A195DNG8_9HYME|nr:hypothetical protein ALC57_13543 [Trachymyrmex cornetzi]